MEHMSLEDRMFGRFPKLTPEQEKELETYYSMLHRRYAAARRRHVESYWEYRRLYLMAQREALHWEWIRRVAT